MHRSSLAASLADVRPGSSQFTLLPSIIFSCMSFLVFYMSFEVGERLGFGITLFLTVEFSKSAMAELLPICGELLWME